MNKFNELEAFAAVVDQGGFTDAAKQIGVSKSVVSKHISSLEARLGARLLIRSTRRVAPTEIGSAYYTRVRRVLTEASEADALVTNMQSKPTGVLRVGCEADFGIHVLSPLLKTFNTHLPSVDLDIELYLSPKNLIASGWDVAIQTGPIPDSELIVRKIGSARTHLIASPGYVVERGIPRRVEDLNSHELIHSGTKAEDTSWQILTHTGEMREIRNLGHLSINEGTSQLAAARAGLGIARLPDFLCQDALKSRQVMEVLADLPPQNLGIYALHAAAEHTPSKIRAFVEFLSQNLD